MKKLAIIVIGLMLVCGNSFGGWHFRSDGPTDFKTSWRLTNAGQRAWMVKGANVKYIYWAFDTAVNTSTMTFSRVYTYQTSQTNEVTWTNYPVTYTDVLSTVAFIGLSTPTNVVLPAPVTDTIIDINEILLIEDNGTNRVIMNLIIEEDRP